MRTPVLFPPEPTCKLVPMAYRSNGRQRQGNPWGFWSSSAVKSEGSRINHPVSTKLKVGRDCGRQ